MTHLRTPARIGTMLTLLSCVAAWSAHGTVAAQEFAGRDKLRAHSAEFRREVITVTEGVHVAVGFDLGNAILIEGPDGAIIVDTLTSVTSARQVRAEFEKVSRLPVRAIIYTHHHGDHIGGAAAFAEGHTPEIYAHVSMLEEIGPPTSDAADATAAINSARLCRTRCASTTASGLVLLVLLAVPVASSARRGPSPASARRSPLRG